MFGLFEKKCPECGMKGLKEFEAFNERFCSKEHLQAYSAKAKKAVKENSLPSCCRN
ncbi:hypothetical protein HZB89_01415 [archaeon]|nr:hypothetical protein [archaeon]